MLRTPAVNERLAPATCGTHHNFLIHGFWLTIMSLPRKSINAGLACVAALKAGKTRPPYERRNRLPQVNWRATRLGRPRLANWSNGNFAPLPWHVDLNECVEAKKSCGSP